MIEKVVHMPGEASDKGILPALGIVSSEEENEKLRKLLTEIKDAEREAQRVCRDVWLGQKAIDPNLVVLRWTPHFTT